ncbi:hypothetical protein DL98DRAFT_572695 [Cadophora sp. DSE1049]|nr:hypothetical protein DL98DRAFT_572695 [Cadophora sp. DSE1049]
MFSFTRVIGHQDAALWHKSSIRDEKFGRVVCLGHCFSGFLPNHLTRQERSGHYEPVQSHILSRQVTSVVSARGNYIRSTIVESMEPNSKKAGRCQKGTRDVSETSERHECCEYNSYSRMNSAGQAEFADGQHNEATSSSGSYYALSTNNPSFPTHFTAECFDFQPSDDHSDVSTTIKDGLQYTPTQYSNQSYLQKSQNAELEHADGSVYAESPQTDPETSGGDSAYGWTPVSADPAEQEVPESRIIRATPKMTELVDRSFSVREDLFFGIGRVFGIARSPHSSEPSSSEDNFFKKEPLIYNDPVKYRIFQFIVVEMRDDEGHCVCLPVASDHRGYKRKGVRLQELGFIYKNKSKLPDVEGMTLPHVRILSKERFPDPCLMDYSRIYIIECGTEVKEIGVLSASSIKRLCQNFLAVHPQARQTDGTLYFRPNRTESLSKEDTLKRNTEDEEREQNASRIALDHEAQRQSDLDTRNRSRRQNVTEAEWSDHHRASNFPSHTSMQASSPSYTYRNAPHSTAVPVNRTSGSTSMYGTIDRRAGADDMGQKGGVNAPKAVEAARPLASLKRANQEGSVHEGKQKATQPVIQLTPASPVPPQVTLQNASTETIVSMSPK